ncbi:MAG: 2-amino-4-hydroxy-6-hydroxymethyldihydropteridine diphosphokinase [Enhydrobacter sp.]|nr:MAG: 2-amino-4-hydroxy-6-hydroxymethyldihydropteridine diphosphokinase [Enhydrobacter sp.]
MTIFVALGANLDHPRYGAPMATLAAALEELNHRRAKVMRVSPWYRSAPIPPSGQPWYVNGVVELAWERGPDELLAELHAVEEAFGRVRTEPNAARLIDLDLIDFKSEIRSGRVELPHPRMTLRAFVLRPLADLSPGWRHPVSGLSVRDLIGRLGPDQSIERLPVSLRFGPGRV